MAFDAKSKKCESCNKKNVKRMEIHHVNGNHNDNQIENLMVLCSSCHHIIDKRINNIFSKPEWKNKMARTLQIKNMNGLVERDEYGRFISSNDIIKSYKEPLRNKGKKHTTESKHKTSMTFQFKRTGKLLPFIFKNIGGNMNETTTLGERR
jgi:hypothetical protein